MTSPSYWCFSRVIFQKLKYYYELNTECNISVFKFMFFVGFGGCGEAGHFLT